MPSLHAVACVYDPANHAILDLFLYQETCATVVRLSCVQLANLLILKFYSLPWRVLQGGRLLNKCKGKNHQKSCDSSAIALQST